MSKTSKKLNRQPGRGISTTTANGYVAQATAYPVVTFPTNTYPDARFYQPDRRLTYPAARNLNAARLVARDRFGDAVRRQTKAPISFRVPDQVALCVRRKQRKEVLHAMAKTGRGYRKKPHYNFWSKISCR